jgi:hypothetical protein
MGFQPMNHRQDADATFHTASCERMKDMKRVALPILIILLLSVLALSGCGK